MKNDLKIFCCLIPVIGHHPEGGMLLAEVITVFGAESELGCQNTEGILFFLKNLIKIG